MPDYFICFGPVAFQVANAHLPYDLVAILDVFCQDRYRPELMWRTFDPIPVDKDHGGAVYIFKKHPEPPPPAPNISDFKL